MNNGQTVCGVKILKYITAYTNPKYIHKVWLNYGNKKEKHKFKFT